MINDYLKKLLDGENLSDSDLKVIKRSLDEDEERWINFFRENEINEDLIPEELLIAYYEAQYEAEPAHLKPSTISNTIALVRLKISLFVTNLTTPSFNLSKGVAFACALLIIFLTTVEKNNTRSKGTPSSYIDHTLAVHRIDRNKNLIDLAKENFQVAITEHLLFSIKSRLEGKLFLTYTINGKTSLFYPPNEFTHNFSIEENNSPLSMNGSFISYKPDQTGEIIFCSALIDPKQPFSKNDILLPPSKDDLQTRCKKVHVLKK